MIKPVEMYLLICDDCLTVFREPHIGNDAFNSIESLMEDAEENGWFQLEAKHYCPKCAFSDEE